MEVKVTVKSVEEFIEQLKKGTLFEEIKATKKLYMQIYGYADQGDLTPLKLIILGTCYRYGIPVKRNQVIAHDFYKRAALSGYDLAQYYEGFCCNYGLGTKKSLKNAEYWYKKAAKQGNVTILTNLGEFYIFNRKSNKYYAKNGFNCFKLAARKGDHRAQSYLGDCFLKGIGIKQDYNKALYWYVESQPYCSKSQLTLGMCYFFGWGVEKNDDIALEWLYKAKANGCDFINIFINIVKTCRVKKK